MYSSKYWSLWVVIQAMQRILALPTVTSCHAYIQHRVGHCQSRKKYPWPPTLASFMMGVHNSIYKNYLFHINTCIWTHKLWICGRYHRCLRHRIFFFSADHTSQELLC
jgi:hypothetical protein